MPTPETIATRFARCLELFRDPAAKQAQKLEFRALLELLAEAPVTLKADAGRLEVNGVACEGKALTALLQRLDLHGVAEIALPQGPPPTQLFELFKALADQPDQEDLSTRLGSAGADRIRVTNAGAPPAPATAPSRPITSPASPLPIAAPSGGGGADALAELQRNPAAPNAGDLLGAVIDQAEMALKRNRPEEVLRFLAAILRLEQRLPEAGGVRRQYAIVVRRICTRPVVEMLARLVTVPKHRTDATLALQRAGAEAVEVLLDLLVAAPTMSERRGVFDALTQMTQGTEQLVHMLDHPEWFVVRNVAELVGELGMEEAVPGLGKQLSHEDERVRRAVALALAKIGSGSAVEPLRRALRDKSPEVRMQVALGIGGRKSNALAMPLVVAMEEEADEAVLRELILALGRIGSPDAVQALIKLAQPSGRIFGRKPAALRAAAVEALRLAGTPPAIGTLQGLAGDGDKQVKAAARAALQDLKRKPGP